MVQRQAENKTPDSKHMQSKTWLIHEMDSDGMAANAKPEHVAAENSGGRMSGRIDRGAQTDAKVELASA